MVLPLSDVAGTPIVLNPPWNLPKDFVGNHHEGPAIEEKRRVGVFQTIELQHQSHKVCSRQKHGVVVGIYKIANGPYG